MTVVAKLRAYRDSDRGIPPYSYLDADDAAKILALYDAVKQFLKDGQGYSEVSRKMRKLERSK